MTVKELTMLVDDELLLVIKESGSDIAKYIGSSKQMFGRFNMHGWDLSDSKVISIRPIVLNIGIHVEETKLALEVILPLKFFPVNT